MIKDIYSDGIGQLTFSLAGVRLCRNAGKKGPIDHLHTIKSILTLI